MSPLQEKIELLRQACTPERYDKIFEVASRRTTQFAAALEDIFDPHNASAVMRSAEAFGLLKVFVIENRHLFDMKDSVSMGSEKWLSVEVFKMRHEDKGRENTRLAFEEIRRQGYIIAAATPHTDDELPDLDFGQKICFLFGSEKDGLSEYALRHSDLRFRIPMQGMVESLNISVSAAITLFTARNTAEKQESLSCLSPQERDEVIFQYLKKSIRASEQILRRQSK